VYDGVFQRALVPTEALSLRVSGLYCFIVRGHMQVSAVKAELEQERQTLVGVQSQHAGTLAAVQQHQSELEEQIETLKQELGDAQAKIEAGKENERGAGVADTNGGGPSGLGAKTLEMQEKEAVLQKSVRAPGVSCSHAFSPC
jgi:predicted  nucleic acid-binding Zn-ribbon protein